MKLSICKAIRDKNKEKTGSEPIDHMAIVVDKVNRKAEVMDIDCAEIISFGWNGEDGFLVMRVRIGGMDEEGKFHAAPQYQAAPIQINRDDGPDWSSLELDKFETLGLDKLRQWLHDSGIIKQMAASFWGIQDLESEIVK
jgi:hypothetical protein